MTSGGTDSPYLLLAEEIFGEFDMVASIFVIEAPRISVQRLVKTYTPEDAIVRLQEVARRKVGLRGLANGNMSASAPTGVS